LTDALAFLPVFGQPQDSDLISIKQASEVLGVQRNTVKRWCKEGRLPAVKRGLTWWVHQDELQRTALDQLMDISVDDLANPGASHGESEALARAVDQPSRVGAQD
jgi:excisionase family DNA binding protein